MVTERARFPHVFVLVVVLQQNIPSVTEDAAMSSLVERHKNTDQSEPSNNHVTSDCRCRAVPQPPEVM